MAWEWYCEDELAGNSEDMRAEWQLKKVAIQHEGESLYLKLRTDAAVKKNYKTISLFRLAAV